MEAKDGSFGLEFKAVYNYSPIRLETMVKIYITYSVWIGVGACLLWATIDTFWV
jgi:hypothetical protein